MEHGSLLLVLEVAWCELERPSMGHTHVTYNNHLSEGGWIYHFDTVLQDT